MSECAIEKIKEVIRSSPEYIVCTVKPVTHYASHDESPPAGRSAYTEVDPDELQRSDNEEGEDSNYTTVEISAQSLEDLCRMDSYEEDTRKPSLPDHSPTSDAVEHEKGGVGRKQTNYAELEFGSR